MLSVAARAYIIYQVFDFVHRNAEPVRFVQLKEELEDLAAWPEFQEAAINDPRFLVVGDCIDIATSGIHTSCEAEEIVVQTIDLLRVPMTDYTLARLVRRLRPDLPTDVDPIENSLATGRVFRTRDKHLAILSWLKGTRPLLLPEWHESSIENAGIEILREVGKPLNAAVLAATIAERFNISIKETYKTLAGNPALLLLPDGTISLYDLVSDEVSSIIRQENSKSYNINQAESAVPLPGEIEAAQLPPNLLRLVVQRCLSTGKPLGTSEILRDLLCIGPRDRCYVATFRSVTSVLGYSAEVVPVGHNLWQATALVPVEVFRRVNKNKISNIETGITTGQVQSTAKLSMTEKKKIDQVSFEITEAELESGCISNPRLGLIMPDYPMIQVIHWNELNSTIWYNAEYRTLYRLRTWFVRKGVQPGDRVLVTIQDGRLHGTVHKKLGEAFNLIPSQIQKKVMSGSRSLLTAVKDNLISAGYFLDREELMALLNEDDPGITWAEVEPLFERFPLLRYNQGLCYYIPQNYHSGVNKAINPAVQAGVLNIISNLPEEVRSSSHVLELAHFVASQPRVSADEERLLIMAAQKGAKAEMEQLLRSHLRHVLRHFLHRNDIEEILPDIEDYFQEGVIGLIDTVRKFDCKKPIRLQSEMSWRVKSAFDEAKAMYALPIRLPDHMYWQVVKAKKKADFEPVLEDVTDSVVELSQEKAEFWLNVTFDDWDSIASEYEEDNSIHKWIGAEASELKFEDKILLQELINNTLITSLTPREADVVTRRFGLGGRRNETFNEIAADYCLTRSRIQQIESRAIKRLRRKIYIKKLF